MTEPRGASGLPARIEKIVGRERADAAADAARRTVETMDRDNAWYQEPAHVFRPLTVTRLA
ncbi:MAG: hypothetical protein OXE86_15140 [Alphaproteobacteria bacterium]|nr:hypothetical protein [Alphaproteobacteria bacterium]